MYSQTFFVTSVRAKDLAPQIADRASLRLFLAKRPLPAFLIVVFFVVVVGTVVFVVVVIASEG